MVSFGVEKVELRLIEVGQQPANERMQLTWLLGAPSQAGFGSRLRRRATRPRLSRHAADASRWAALRIGKGSE